MALVEDDSVLLDDVVGNLWQLAVQDDADTAFFLVVDEVVELAVHLYSLDVMVEHAVQLVL